MGSREANRRRERVEMETAFLERESVLRFFRLDREREKDLVGD